jgi:hypothetical protein
MYFLQMLDWFSTVDTVVVGQLLQKWPTPDDLQRAPALEVADFLCTYHISDSRIAVLQQLIEQAVPAIRGFWVSSLLVRADVIRQIGGFSPDISFVRTATSIVACRSYLHCLREQTACRDR